MLFPASSPGRSAEGAGPLQRRGSPSGAEVPPALGGLERGQRAGGGPQQGRGRATLGVRRLD